MIKKLVFHWKYGILLLYVKKKDGAKMEKVKKEKITLSLSKETKKDLDELSKQYGMTKSGLVNFLIQRLKEREDLFK